MHSLLFAQKEKSVLYLNIFLSLDDLDIFSVFTNNN